MPQGTYIDSQDLNSIARYIKQVAKPDAPLRHENYAATVKHAKEMSVHINGDSPTELLTAYRPNEPKEIHEYRLKIYQPITKSKSKKIINVLARINNAKHYSINFPQEISGLIKNSTSDESLQSYTSKEYPYFGNLVQWVFDIALKQMLADPNSVICFRPINSTAPDGQFVNPYGYVYGSVSVVDFSQDEYYTILTNEKSSVIVGQTPVREGLVYDIYTRNEIIRVKQYGLKHENKFRAEIFYVHNIGEVPVIVIGGEFKEGSDPFMYESFISGILPFWNDAIREFSDKQATFVQHVYLERVEIQTECDNSECGNGVDKLGNQIPQGSICQDGKAVVCKRCSGTGFITGRSPYGITSVKKDSLQGTDPIFPGVEYISKPTEIITLLKTDIQEQIDAGYEAINMDVIFKIGLDQSGKAKEIDRTELDGFFTLVSNNIFDNILFYAYKYINAMRYGKIFDKKTQLAHMPVISKPISFDVLSINRMIADYGSKANLPQQLSDNLLLDILDKLFSNDEQQRLYNRALVTLDPLRGKTEDEKFLLYTNQVIGEIEYRVSSNIKYLLAQAFANDKNFFSLPENEKYKVLEQLAKAVSL